MDIKGTADNVDSIALQSLHLLSQVVPVTFRELNISDILYCQQLPHSNDRTFARKPPLQPQLWFNGCVQGAMVCAMRSRQHQ